MKHLLLTQGTRMLRLCQPRVNAFPVKCWRQNSNTTHHCSKWTNSVTKIFL